MLLLEREQALRVAAGYLTDATAGHGRLVFVAGEAGVGKTSFVTQVIADAGAEASAALGTCDGSGTPAPLGALAEMLPRLPPGVWPAEAARHEVFTRLAAALREPGPPPAHLLIFEDVHWADEATLDLLRYLARRAHAFHALILVTYRGEDATAGHPLRQVIGDAATAAGVRRLDLAPLSQAAVASLARHPVRADADADVPPIDTAELFRVTGGNPFFVTEVLAAGSAETPATVRDAVMARVARLPEAARSVLDLIALAGPRVEISLLEALSIDALTAAEDPMSQGMLRLTGSVITFRHELARLAVAEQIPGCVASRSIAGSWRPSWTARARWWSPATRGWPIMPKPRRTLTRCCGTPRWPQRKRPRSGRTGRPSPSTGASCAMPPGLRPSAGRTSWDCSATSATSPTSWLTRWKPVRKPSASGTPPVTDSTPEKPTAGCPACTGSPGTTTWPGSMPSSRYRRLTARTRPN